MLIFVQGGMPGLTPYASGAHIWGAVLQRFGNVKAIELQGDTLDAMVESVKAQLDEASHLVGHDLGGLVALTVACEVPGRVRSVSAVASVPAAPTGDGVPNLTFAYPPQPLWSRDSQRWALERVSYSHHHIDDALLDSCVDASKKQRPVKDEFLPSLMGAKSRFYELCRSRGFPVPAQIIWGTHDPLGSFDHGLWLFRLIAARQKAAHFHAINRAGSLLFREEPEAFHQVVSAFVGSL
jgi:pimeloyl-ACP methyl ester carboxylesterase